MAGKSDYLENKWLDHVLGNTAYIPASTLYVALFTATPSDSGGGTEVSTSSTGYARASVTNNTTNWSNASAGVKTNATAITFATSTASWGTVTHWAVFDASTAGNMLHFGALGSSQTVGTNNTLSFASGQLSITETGKSQYLSNKLLDLTYGGTSYTAPATTYMALYTVTPTDSTSGTEVSTSSTGYARVAVTNNTTNWPNASAGSKSNGGTISYGTSTASWGTVVAASITDASTAGNILYYGALTSSQNVGVNNVVSYNSSTVTISED